MPGTSRASVASAGRTTYRRSVRASKWLLLVASAAVVAAAGAARSSGAAPTTSPGAEGIGGIVPPLSATHRAPTLPDGGDLTWHGGRVMRTNTTHAIYWAPSGHPFPDGYVHTIDQFLTDVAHDSGGADNVYGIGTQYSDEAGHIAYRSTFGGSVVDTNPYPASGCDDAPYASICLTNAQLQAEILSVVNREGWPKDGSAMYFLFTPKGVGSCFNGRVALCSYSIYCGYHRAFSTSHRIIYANQPYDAVPQCDEGQYPNGNSADATINIVSHEHNEAITDPHLNAWYDAQGEENGDKCVWDFGTVSGPDGAEYTQTINGHHYFLQREFDNSTHACQQRPAGPTPATVTSVKPAALGQGGTSAQVKIDGSNFAKGAAVSVSGSGVTVDSITSTGLSELVVRISVAPGAATGKRDVTVTNPGAAAGTCTGCLTVEPRPLVASVAPSTGARGTSEAVRILGSDFASGATVKFDVGVKVLSETFVGSGEIDATISIASTAKRGGHPVTVTNPDKGVGTLADALTVS